MTLGQFRLTNNKIIIQFLPLLIILVLSLFIFLDGNILYSQFHLGLKSFLYISFFVELALVPTLIYLFLSFKFFKKLKEVDNSKFLLLSCYFTIYILFLIDIALVTFMPVKFCGIIGQIGFSIAYLLLGNMSPPKYFIVFNSIFLGTSIIGPYIENRFTPSYWPTELLVRMPGSITIPSIIFLIIGITLINFIYLRDSKKAYKTLMDLEFSNTHDQLTKAFNRTYLKPEFLLDRFFLILDIDKFKLVNDNYGHLMGDNCLKKLVEIVNSVLVKDESILRYGGEEFIIKLNCKDILGALIKAELIRSTVERDSKEVLPFTISMGLVFYQKEATLEENIKAADAYLYMAKENGRNQICSDCKCYRNSEII